MNKFTTINELGMSIGMPLPDSFLDKLLKSKDETFTVNYKPDYPVVGDVVNIEFDGDSFPCVVTSREETDDKIHYTAKRQ